MIDVATGKRRVLLSAPNFHFRRRGASHLTVGTSSAA